MRFKIVQIIIICRFIALICEMFLEVGDSLNLMEVEKIGAK